jgi:hypothetical protein
MTDSPTEKQVILAWDHFKQCSTEPESFNLYRLEGIENDGFNIMKQGQYVGKVLPDTLFIETFDLSHEAVYSYTATAVNKNGESDPCLGVAVIV